MLACGGLDEPKHGSICIFECFVLSTTGTEQQISQCRHKLNLLLLLLLLLLFTLHVNTQVGVALSPRADASGQGLCCSGDVVVCIKVL